MLFTGLGSVPVVKNCDLGVENTHCPRSFSLYGPPSRQITYMNNHLQHRGHVCGQKKNRLVEYE